MCCLCRRFLSGKKLVEGGSGLLTALSDTSGLELRKVSCRCESILTPAASNDHSMAISALLWPVFDLFVTQSLLRMVASKVGLSRGPDRIKELPTCELSRVE
jgi:hypothetical protein